MWFQRAEADLKCLTHKGKQSCVNCSRGRARTLILWSCNKVAVEFIEPTIKVDVIKSVVNRAGD